MAIEIDIMSLQPFNVTDSQRAAFGAIEGSLRSSAEPQAKTASIAEKMRLLCASEYSSQHVSATLWDIWEVLLDVVFLTPADHPWQDALVDAFGSLRQQGGSIGTLKQGRELLWEDLPNLAGYMLDKWYDPTDFRLADFSKEDVLKWKNLNSFAARLTTPEFAPWLTFPIWELRRALEVEPSKGFVMDCKVWVATEWIIRCGEVVFEDMSSPEQLDEGTAKATRTGPLCQGIPARSVKRWEFWKKRLLDIATRWGELELESVTPDRIGRAVAKMEAVEAGNGVATIESS